MLSISLTALASTTLDKDILKDQDTFTKAREKGILYTLLVAFLGGILASLTPCVFPMIFITISFFGLQSGGIRSKTILLVLVYILGIAISYSALGVGAALSGNAFGAFLGNSYVIIGISILFAILGLAMFGVYEFQIPHFITNKIASSKRGLIGALVMGLLVGIIASPCVGPILLGILLYISTTKDPYLGLLFLFTFSTGMGVIFFIASLFPKILPKSGQWLLLVKNIFGVALFGVALWYLGAILSIKSVSIISGILLFILTIYIFIKVIKTKPTLIKKVLCYLLAIFTFILSGFFIIGLFIPYEYTSVAEYVMANLLQKDIHKVEWIYDIDLGLEKAKLEKKPIIIEFTSNVCIDCRKMEVTTFSDNRVLEEIKRFVALKVDIMDEKGSKFFKIYKFVGVPSTAFHNSDGDYLPKFSGEGFKSADELLNILQQIK